MTKLPIELTNEEWLVIFDFLADRINNKDTIDFSHPEFAHKVAFSNLLNALESELVEPFAKDYATLLNRAKTEVIGEHDETAYE